MSQMSTRRKNKGTDSGVKKRSNKKLVKPFKNTSKRSAVSAGETKDVTAQKKVVANEPPHVTEMRSKVKLLYLMIVSVCGIIILTFSFLVANKLSKAGVLLEPEDFAEMAAIATEAESSEPSTHTSETEETSVPSESTMTGVEDVTVTITARSVVNTAAAQVAPPVRKTYSYGNVNIEGGMEVITSTTTAATTSTSTSTSQAPATEIATSAELVPDDTESVTEDEPDEHAGGGDGVSDEDEEVVETP